MKRIILVLLAVVSLTSLASSQEYPWRTITGSDGVDRIVYLAALTAPSVPLANLTLSQTNHEAWLKSAFVETSGGTDVASGDALQLLWLAQSSAKFGQTNIAQVFENLNSEDLEFDPQYDDAGNWYPAYVPWFVGPNQRPGVLWSFDGTINPFAGLDYPPHRRAIYKTVLLEAIAQPDIGDNDFVQALQRTGLLLGGTRAFLNLDQYVSKLSGTAPLTGQEFGTILQGFGLFIGGLNLSIGTIQVVDAKQAIRDRLRLENSRLRFQALNRFITANASVMDIELVNAFNDIKNNWNTYYNDCLQVWGQAIGDVFSQAAVYAASLAVYASGISAANPLVGIAFFITSLYLENVKADQAIQRATLAATLRHYLFYIPNDNLASLRAAIGNAGTGPIEEDDLLYALNMYQINFYLANYFYDRCYFALSNPVNEIWQLIIGNINDFQTAKDHLTSWRDLNFWSTAFSSEPCYLAWRPLVSSPANGTDEFEWLFNEMAPYVRVIQPNGGSNFTVGSTQTVSWRLENAELDGKQVVELSTNGGSTFLYPLLNSTNLSTRQVPWTVPDDVSDHCLIRVKHLRPSSIPTFWELAAEDGSDQEFRIVPNGTILPPSAPANITISAGDKKVYLSWDFNPAEEGVSKYYIYRGNSAGGQFNKKDSVSSSQYTFTDVNLTNETEYCYKLSARNTAGEGSLSSPAKCATPQQPQCPISLIEPSVNPLSGGPSTSFHLQVIYKHTQSLPPTGVYAFFDGDSNNKWKLQRVDNNPFSQGSLYDGWRTFAPGSHAVQFEASDGNCSVVTTPPITIVVSPPVGSILFLSSVNLYPTYVSANGDGVQDANKISYQFAGTCLSSKRIEIYDEANQLVSTPLACSFCWQNPGRDSLLFAPQLPDGTYNVKVSISNFGLFQQFYSAQDNTALNDLALGPDGKVYVARFGRIDVFAVSQDCSQITYERSIHGVPGQPYGDGVLERPLGLHVDKNGNIYVAEATSGSCRVTKMNNSGTILCRFGSRGHTGDPFNFYYPSDVVTDSLDNIYVIDQGNQKVKKFSPCGSSFLGQTSINLLTEDWAEKHKIVYDGCGHLYVSDFRRVLRFDLNLQLEREYPTVTGNGWIDPAAICLDDEGHLIAAGGESGVSNGGLKFDTSSGAVVEWSPGTGCFNSGHWELDYIPAIIQLPCGDLLAAGDPNLKRFSNSHPSLFATSNLVCDTAKPTVQITSPSNQSFAMGTVTAIGTACDPNLNSWTLVSHPKNSSSPTPIASSSICVMNDVLGAWVTGSANGEYYIVLEADDRAGNKQADSVLVKVNVAQPTITVLHPNGSETLFGLSSDSVTWSAANLTTGELHVQLYTQDGGWEELFSTPDLAIRKITWSIPQVDTDSARVFVGLRNETSWLAGDYSDNLFRLRKTIPCGDADGSGQVDLSDVVFMIAYVFDGSPIPQPIEIADVDCSRQVDLSDVVYLINYIFIGGAAPCAACK